jgi:hypothetical protein
LLKALTNSGLEIDRGPTVLSEEKDISFNFSKE